MGKVYFLFYHDCAPVHRATPIDARCDELSVEKPKGPTPSQTLLSDISELSPAILEGRAHLCHLAVFLECLRFKDVTGELSNYFHIKL